MNSQRIKLQHYMDDSKSFDIEGEPSSKANKDSEFTISSQTSEKSPLENPKNREFTTQKNEDDSDDESIIGSIKVNKMHVDTEGIEHE